ncbi:TPA: Holliday junction branch migration DNA helicase RuvB [Patescibacteria group bacterium]|nr:Holliday junction branch migration DNA helicase RuvB [Patescibacteria group bacterium]|tara:strand:- start:150 stop:1127 length:978 start_codon:yes stop_codon:yes gene_type:complete
MDNLTIDGVLRPVDWDDYVGQEKIKINLRIILDAAKKRGEACDHLLFYGQAGLGKTTLANLVAKDLGFNLKVTSGPALEKMGDLAAVLSNLEENDVLFIDEAHRLNKSIEEVLYPAMESRKLHLVIGKGPGARTVALDLPSFTIIAATTRPHLLSGPLRSRFGASFKLDFYDLKDICRIVKRSAQVLNMNMSDEAVEALARSSRSTPRVANRLLKRVRDFADVHDIKQVDKATALNTLNLLEIDNMGLEPMDRRLLEVIIDKFDGGPVGINSLAAALNDDVGNIEDVYEPHLLSIGFLVRTSTGRVVREAAYRHLGREISEEKLI